MSMWPNNFLTMQQAALGKRRIEGDLAEQQLRGQLAQQAQALNEQQQREHEYEFDQNLGTQRGYLGIAQAGEGRNAALFDQEQKGREAYPGMLQGMAGLFTPGFAGGGFSPQSGYTPSPLDPPAGPYGAQGPTSPGGDPSGGMGLPPDFMAAFSQQPGHVQQQLGQMILAHKVQQDTAQRTFALKLMQRDQFHLQVAQAQTMTPQQKDAVLADYDSKLFGGPGLPGAAVASMMGQGPTDVANIRAGGMVDAAKIRAGGVNGQNVPIDPQWIQTLHDPNASEEDVSAATANILNARRNATFGQLGQMRPTAKAETPGTSFGFQKQKSAAAIRAKLIESLLMGGATPDEAMAKVEAMEPHLMGGMMDYQPQTTAPASTQPQQHAPASKKMSLDDAKKQALSEGIKDAKAFTARVRALMGESK